MDRLQNRVGPGQTRHRPWTPGYADSIPISGTVSQKQSGSPEELMTTILVEEIMESYGIIGSQTNKTRIE